MRIVANALIRNRILHTTAGRIEEIVVTTSPIRAVSVFCWVPQIIHQNPARKTFLISLLFAKVWQTLDNKALQFSVSNIVDLSSLQRNNILQPHIPDKGFLVPKVIDKLSGRICQRHNMMPSTYTSRAATRSISLVIKWTEKKRSWVAR